MKYKPVPLSILSKLTDFETRLRPVKEAFHRAIKRSRDKIRLDTAQPDIFWIGLSNHSNAGFALLDQSERIILFARVFPNGRIKFYDHEPIYKSIPPLYTTTLRSSGPEKIDPSAAVKALEPVMLAGFFYILYQLPPVEEEDLPPELVE